MLRLDSRIEPKIFPVTEINDKDNPKDEKVKYSEAPGDKYDDCVSIFADQTAKIHLFDVSGRVEYENDEEDQAKRINFKEEEGDDD